jgi:ectoine hydroxylase-related dioxygenase (phytanoyl-CoA dioxygenase family)
MSFEKNGYKVIKLCNKKQIVNLRKKFIETFKLASTLNNSINIKSDLDVLNLYKNKKKLWVAAYDQLRMLPDIYFFFNENFKKKLKKNTKIRFPALTSKPLVRVVMPGNIGTSKAAAHIDYPTYLGSKNAITIWIPLQKMDNSNGSLKILPGSHKKKNKHLSKIYKGTITKTDSMNKKKLKSIYLNPGEALIFSHFLVHESGENLSKKIRFSIDLRFNDLSSAPYAKRHYYLNESVFYKK